MPRKNNNAGQPNRQAQTIRRAVRRDMSENFRRVYGPGSEQLVRTPVKVSVP